VVAVVVVWVAEKRKKSPDQTKAPSETHINQHEERPNIGFPPKPSMILASRKHTS
jgi:hypothetical protein